MVYCCPEPIRRHVRGLAKSDFASSSRDVPEGQSFSSLLSHRPLTFGAPGQPPRQLSGVIVLHVEVRPGRRPRIDTSQSLSVLGGRTGPPRHRNGEADFASSSRRVRMVSASPRWTLRSMRCRGRLLRWARRRAPTSRGYKRSAPAIAVSHGERAAPGYQPYGL